jgi:integrase
LRYRFAGVQKIMNLGSYGDLSIASARDTARKLRAKVALGEDVAASKQKAKADAVAAMEHKRNVRTVSKLADEYFERMILGRWKHPNIVRSRIEKDIKPKIGAMPARDVRPRHIDGVLKAVLERGAPTIANDVLRWLRRIFDYGVKREYVEMNPASAFDLNDAGGKEEARKRWLTRDELQTLFRAMRGARGFSVENDLTVRILLALAVRKGELCAARWREFDLDGAVWSLPEGRSKTGVPIEIPLPPNVVGWLKDLKRLACGSDYVLPARKMQTRFVPHVHEGTLSTALGKVRHGLERFTVHDLRRTARTHLEALGTPPHVAERCLNHKVTGVEGVYNRHDYFEERRDALCKWANLLDELDRAAMANDFPMRTAQPAV